MPLLPVRSPWVPWCGLGRAAQGRNWMWAQGMSLCPRCLQELHGHSSAGSLSVRGGNLASAQLRYLASQHQLKVQGSAPGSQCSGCGIVDRELQLVIETELQLWCFMTLSLSGGCCRQFSAGKPGAGCGISTGIGAAAPAVPGQQAEATVPGTWLWEGSGGSSGSAGGLTQMPVPDMSWIYWLLLSCNL